MKVNSSLFPQWISDCFSSISSFFSRIKTAVLRALGCLSEDKVNEKPIIASPKKEEPKLKKIGQNKFPSPGPSKKEQPPKSNPPKNPNPSNVNTQSDRITDDDIKANKQIIDKDRKEHEFDPIIEKSMTPQEFGEARYTMKIESKFDLNRQDQLKIAERNKLNAKFRARLVSIGSFYGKNSVLPVRGDGNCFCNAVVAGLLTMIQKDPSRAREIIELLEKTQGSNIPYVLPASKDSLQEYDYSKYFTKEKDFKAVLQKLKAGITKDSFSDFDFTSKFSRIIRYILLVDTKDASYPRQTGHEIEMMGMLIINNVFNIHAKVVVLENSSQNQDLMVNSDDPNVFLEVPGTDPATEPLKIVDTANDDKEAADFLVVHRNGHYFAMV